MIVSLSIPFPPSANRIWRRAGHRIYLAPDGLKYRSAVSLVVNEISERFGDRRLDVCIVATMPDRRRRDLDNLLKASLDALMHAGLFEDDGQIDRIEISRGSVLKPGGLEITIKANLNRT